MKGKTRAEIHGEVAIEQEWNPAARIAGKKIEKLPFGAGWEVVKAQKLGIDREKKLGEVSR